MIQKRRAWNEAVHPQAPANEHYGVASVFAPNAPLKIDVLDIFVVRSRHEFGKLSNADVGVQKPHRSVGENKIRSAGME